MLDKFLNKELDPKDYEESATEKQISKMLAEPYETYTKADLNEITENIVKLSKTLEEFQNYLKYKYVYEAVLKIYKEKDKYKNLKANLKKQIKNMKTLINSKKCLYSRKTVQKN